MTKPAKLRIPARPEKLSTLHRFITGEAQVLRVDPYAVSQIDQAVDEAVANIIMHGYRGARGQIMVEISTAGRDLIIRITDKAPHFDPTHVPAPDLDLPLEERPLGGLGVFFIRNMVDEVSYRPLPRRGNELVLVKYDVIKN